MERKHSQSEIASIRKSLQIVDLIQEQDGATITEIVGKMGLSKSTVYKHLNTLSNRGYITKSGEEYNIGLRFFHRGEYARTRKLGYKLAAETVQELANETNEETDFLVENYGRMLAIYESYHPENPYRDRITHPSEFREFAGTYYPIHSIAAGKATLAAYSQDRVKQILNQWGLPQQTEQTIRSEGALFEELEQIRERGYARSDEEFADGLRSIAKTVTDVDGSLLGAFAISGPTYRMSGEKYEEELPKLLNEKVEDFEDTLNERMQDQLDTEEGF